MPTIEQIAGMTDVQVNCYLGKQVMGWTVEVASNCWIDDCGAHSPEWWNPSGCLDDAMKAAEKELLFSRKHGGWLDLRGPDGDTYWTCVGHDPRSGRSPIARAATPARAVCNAVIAVHEAS
jgi:hypothetical protein